MDVDCFGIGSCIALLRWVDVGALELGNAAGFTGEATVDGTSSPQEYYGAALRYSSDATDYDALVRIAGLAG